ncbi:MAG: M14 family metallopeptidase [Ottowia sp.]|uniref:M14 family metallopeptidase n=1 Tax=Ottowia sp. TaxID=1898956 RepID=UPI003C78BA13
MQTSTVSQHFAGTYAEARRKFLDAAGTLGAVIETFELPGYLGAQGETLATDIAYLGARTARRLLILSSATHGPEGFCGSGCQIATLHDADLLQRLERASIAMLMIHAVNPYGFSHLQRTNQDNVDLNRNHIDFSAGLPRNEGYPALDPLIIPATWPATAEDDQALAAYVDRHGLPAYHSTLSRGQYSNSGGMFFGGFRPTWNNLTVRRILRAHASEATHIGWIDLHTGLGPNGHGEKIYAGQMRPADLARARAWWGSDVFAPFEGNSESPVVSGPVACTLYDECPQAASALMALEFGTLPFMEMIERLRASHWLIRHPDAPAVQQQQIRQQVRDAFYCDNDAWKGAIWGQTRVALLQALTGLASPSAK